MRSSKSSSLVGAPASITVRCSGPTSTIFPSNTPTSWMTWPRDSGPASTVASSSSRSRECAGSSSVIETTGISLSSCLMIWSSGADSTSTTMVIRLNLGLSDGATARLKML